MMSSIKTVLMLMVVLWTFNVYAFDVPPLTAPVMDNAGMLDSASRDRIDAALRFLKQSGGSQITVLTLPSLEGMAIEQASIKVVEQWKLGGAKEDNGVLLLLSRDDRKVRIEVGQGLEGNLTDLQSKRIIDQSMVPMFREGRYGDGVLVGIYEIAQRTDPDKDLKPYLEGVQQSRRWEGDGRRRGGGMALVLLAILIPFALAHPLLALILFVIVVFILIRGARYGGYYGGGGWGSGGGGFGSGGGGGWGGGGGGFSGGGASGSW